MNFRNRYLKYDSEITFDIFQKVWDKLISFGYRPFNDSSSIKRYNEFKRFYCFLKTTKDHPMEFSCYSGVVDSFSETTVQEILGYDPFVKDDDFVLPEKWIKNGATPVFDTFKVNSDNTINVKLIKESYTRADVISLLNDFGEHVCNELLGHKLSMIGELNKWAEENL